MNLVQVIIMKTPFNKKELTEFQTLLLQKKARVIQEIQDQQEGLENKEAVVGDIVDMAANLLAQ